MQTDEHSEGTAPALSDSLDHSSLPDVIIVPPAEERLATPPWSYFDAQAQAQAQAIAPSGRTENDGGDDDSPIRRSPMPSSEFQVSLGLEGSVVGRGIGEKIGVDLEEIVDPYLHNTQHHGSFEGTQSRGTVLGMSGAGTTAFPSIERDYLGGESFEFVHPPTMSTDNLSNAVTKPRKNSFSSLFRRSNAQNIDSSALSRNARTFLRLGKPTITPKRSFDRPSPARASTVDPIVNRRFSFFRVAQTLLDVLLGQQPVIVVPGRFINIDEPRHS